MRSIRGGHSSGYRLSSCFGHPIGSSGLRMIYEMYLQMLGRAGERQRKELPRLGVTHNLGGFPHQNVCSVAIVGGYEG